MFGGITTYAENAQYRAWNVPKALDYGDTLKLSMTINQRLQAATFKVSKTGLTLIEKGYDYYLDGRLSMSHDETDDRFDHKYSYGPVGEMSTVASGVHARGGTGSRDDIPFDQTYGYDAFGHMNVRDMWHWTESFGWSNSFTNNRGYGWDYDGEGRPTRVGSTADNDELFTTYDAAGNILQTTATENSRTNQEVDGDGRSVGQVK